MTQPLTDAINALTRYANETTGANDQTLSEAVGTLVAGYGQGGGIDWDSYIDSDISGMTVVYEAENLEFTGSNYIDTGIKLFGTENYDYDFKIICHDFMQTSVGDTTLLSTLEEKNPYPGFCTRTLPNGGANYTGVICLVTGIEYSRFVIMRKNGIVTASIATILQASVTGASTPPTYLRSGNFIISVNEVPLTLGCELNGSGNPFRYGKGTIGKIIVAVGK